MTKTPLTRGFAPLPRCPYPRCRYVFRQSFPANSKPNPFHGLPFVLEKNGAIADAKQANLFLTRPLLAYNGWTPRVPRNDVRYSDELTTLNFSFAFLNFVASESRATVSA